MSVPALPEVERLVDSLAREVADTSPSMGAMWHIWGPATGGKSTALKLLADRLSEQGLCPVLVAPPTRVLDAGPLAVAEASVGLKAHNLINGELTTIRDSNLQWSDKVSALFGWIAEQEQKVVLLCDEPGAWSSTSTDDARFRDHADEVALSMVATLACRRVVAGALPTGVRARRSRRLNVESRPSHWLHDANAWGALATEAERVEVAIGSELEHRSPLEIRLLVALASLWSVDDLVRWWTSHPSRRDISRMLADILQSNDQPCSRFLRRAWTHLALVRRPLTDDLLNQVVGVAPTKASEEILRSCLLYPDNGLLTLHWSLRLDAQEHRGWRGAESMATVHADLARHYEDRFNQSEKTGDANSLLDEMEAFYHATLSGDPELLGELRPFFADQLDALGRTLSRDFNQYREAADVFERACRWEPEDDYAHHYMAFNLDILAERSSEVEEHYQRAIELRSTHLWWHSRWVNYLITRGRTDVARRAWTEALDVLGLPDPDAEQWVYENLHLWVARLLVHRGRLEFANEVLGGIPQKALHNHLGLAAIFRRLKALVAARHSHSALPLSIPHARWWDGPHLSPQRSDSGQLVRWMPGRVDAIDQESVHIQGAQPPTASTVEAVYGFLAVRASDFDRWTRDERVGELSAGRYVELAWYGDDEEPMIRVHRDLDWQDPDLPPLFPDPARYLRSAGWVETSE